MLFYVFSLGGRGSRKKRYVTKKGVSNQVLQAVAEGGRGVKMLNFSITYLLNDPKKGISSLKQKK